MRPDESRAVSHQVPHLERTPKLQNRLGEPLEGPHQSLAYRDARLPAKGLPSLPYVRASALEIVLRERVENELASAAEDSYYHLGDLTHAHLEGVAHPLAWFINEVAYQADQKCMQKCTEMVPSRITPST